MKYNFTFCLALFLCFSFQLRAQDKDYSIVGSVKKYPSDAMAYLQYKGIKGEVKDSVAITDGNFTFKGKLDEPRPASIVIKEPGRKTAAQNILKFFIEPGEIVVSTKLMLSTAEISGSPSSLDNKDLNKLLTNQNFAQTEKVAVTQTTRVVSVPAGSMPPSTPVGVGRGTRPVGGTVVDRRVITDISELPYELQARILGMREEAKAKVLQFIKEHPNSFVSMYTLNSLWTVKRITYLEYIALVNILGPNLMASNEGKVMFAK